MPACKCNEKQERKLETSPSNSTCSSNTSSMDSLTCNSCTSSNQEKTKVIAITSERSCTKKYGAVGDNAGWSYCEKQKTVAFEKTFHRRTLPSTCIAFSSPKGRQLFQEAMNTNKGALNYMQIYFPLAEQFTTQSEPAYCGLATLAMCLNALAVDPRRLWKGAWRWYSEELFDCCTPLVVAKENGILLSEFISTANCNGAMTTAYIADENLAIDEFRDLVKKSCSSDSEIIVLNYSRKVLGQTGDGHFSPIGGYHEEKDMVLLLDVARFKYPPHWVALSLVFEAMQMLDKTSQRPRGFIVLQAANVENGSNENDLVQTAS